ncbi:MAG TPA: phage tail protein, partial [Candidatus Saccharimonadales bacterium]|nr:phage tail protein [Candidatus Saccharimonadales bacterium]
MQDPYVGMHKVWHAGDSANLVTQITAGTNVTVSNPTGAGAATVNVPSIPWADLTGVPSASTSTTGIVQLINSTSSTSTTTAATPSSVKSAYDLANAALPKTGGSVTGSVTITAANETLSLRGGTGTDRMFDVWGSADTNARFLIRADGLIYFGNGTGTFDVSLARTAANTLSLTGNLALSGTLTSGTVPWARLSEVPSATTSAAGIVQLTDSTASTSITTAATPNSVKSAYDLANAALAQTGGTITGDITLQGSGGTSTSLIFSGTSPQKDVGIRAVSEAFIIYEPEDGNREWLKINDGGESNPTTAMQIYGWNVYHQGNDGAGSGLDADLLDGVDSSGYAKRAGFSASIASAGWYRIAKNGPVAAGGSGGDRAHAMFTVRDTTSSYHSSTTFYASVHFGSNPTLSLINRSFFSSEGRITQIRIIEGASYEGAAVEVYVSGPATVDFTIYDNEQTLGWTPVDWSAGSVPTGFTTTALNFNTANMVLGTAANGGTNQFWIDRLGDINGADL